MGCRSSRGTIPLRSLDNPGIMRCHGNATAWACTIEVATKFGLLDGRSSASLIGISLSSPKNSYIRMRLVCS